MLKCLHILRLPKITKRGATKVGLLSFVALVGLVLWVLVLCLLGVEKLAELAQEGTDVSMINIKTLNPVYLNPPYQIRDRFRTFLPVVVDVETGGFNPATDALLEVCMITLQIDNAGRLAPKAQYSVNILPFEGSKLVPINVDFLGIDPFDEKRNPIAESVAMKPLFKLISKEVKAQGCTKAILVGHNGAFDLSFINAVATRLKYKRNPFHPFSVIDTASLGALVLGQTVLSRACMSAGISFNDDHAHSAVYDTQKECELFCAMYNRFTKFAGLPM